MAIPKNLKPITKEKALKIINKFFEHGRNDWDGVPMLSDFVYLDKGKLKLIRPGFSDNTWETGLVSQ